MINLVDIIFDVYILSYIIFGVKRFEETFMTKNKILEYRTKSGLTQRQLAERVNITYQSLQRYENGIICPSVVVAIDIAKALGTTVEELYSE